METLDTQTTGVEDSGIVNELDAGGLPSASDDKQLELSKFSIDEELQTKYFRDGKINGKYDNIKDLIEGAKSYEDKYSQLMRDVKSGKYQETNADTTTQADTVNITELAQPLVNKYVENGFELTDDILNEAKEKGLDIRDVKLAAIELKEQFTKAYDIVGGKEEYDSMIAWAKENLSDKAKVDFDKGLKSGMGEWAIKGLYAEYKGSNQSADSQQRIRGDASSGVGVRPYSSQAEILKDKAYLNSHRGRSDEGAKAMYSKRMNITHDDVIFGKR